MSFHSKRDSDGPDARTPDGIIKVTQPRNKTPLHPKGARIPLLILAAWTVAIWLTRIVNVAQAGDLGFWGTLWRVLVAFVFVDLGVATLAWAVSGKFGPRWFVMLATLSVIYWPIRTAQLWADSTQTTGFKLVHTALMLVTIAAVALAVWAVRRARRLPPDAAPSSA
ncbi:hypothetical protein [Candidatus Poriferisodalis sp.]|uniref:hypothetical protein n=1 Tax=Candidatus Poriferisodalis sp. TaxID=3101277 RepID=UPI003D0A9EA2